jgi:hypothetical protein
MALPRCCIRRRFVEFLLCVAPIGTRFTLRGSRDFFDFMADNFVPKPQAVGSQIGGTPLRSGLGPAGDAICVRCHTRRSADGEREVRFQTEILLTVMASEMNM